MNPDHSYLLGPPVVVRQPLHIVLDGVHPSRRYDPRLPHAPPARLPHPPSPINDLLRGDEDGADWGPEALRQADGHGVDGGGDRGNGC